MTLALSKQKKKKLIKTFTAHLTFKLQFKSFVLNSKLSRNNDINNFFI